jgi:hypothetical protein
MSAQIKMNEIQRAFLPVSADTSVGAGGKPVSPASSGSCGAPELRTDLSCIWKSGRFRSPGSAVKIRYYLHRFF